MTTQSKSRHIRADSGLGDIDTFSKNLSNAQSFCAAVASLTSENGFQALTELLELLPQRDNEIKKRDNTIRDLNAQLAAQEKSHNDYNEKQLLTFEHRYHGWNEENISLQSSIEKLEAAAVVKDTEITALQDQLSVIEGKVKDLDEEHTQTTKRLKDRELQLVELGAQLRNSEANADDYKDRQRQSSEQMAALQRSYNEEVRQHRLLMEEATKRRERLMHLTSLSVKIEDLSLPTVIDRTDTIWRSTTELIRDHFGHDLPDEILQSDWTNLLDHAAIHPRISLPRSNSDIAKKIRVAVILRAFARLVDKYIFQPAYLLDEDSGLREILVEQATINPTKERFVRGILLSMLPESQEAYNKKTVNLVVDNLVNNLNLRVLLCPEAVETFAGMLKFLVTKFQDEWKIVQRGKQKIEPSFHYPAPTDHPWHIFDVDIADSKNGKQHNVGATLNTNGAEGDIVILPRLYLVSQDPEPALVTHGCVLQKLLCDAAEGEVRKDIPSAPFARATSSRHRARSNRTMSISGDAAVIGRRGDPFLSQPHGPQDA